MITHDDAMAVVSAVAQAAGVALLTHAAPGTTAEDLLRHLHAVVADLPDPGSRERRRGAGPARVRLADRLASVVDLLDATPVEAFDRLWNGAFVLESLPAAWWCALAHLDDPERALVVAAGGGRDADTVASMAGALLGALHGVDGFPSRWVRELEHRDELVELADDLWRLAGDGDDSAVRPPGGATDAPSGVTARTGDDVRVAASAAGRTTGGGMDVGVVLDHQMVAVEAGREVHLMLELRAPEAAVQRPPLSLALVLDRSGSMRGRPLATVARAAAYLVEQLREDDEVALVTYESEAQLVHALGAPDAHLSAALRALRPGSMTNLSGGWLKGREQLAGARHAAPILLLTDGLANRGETSGDRLAAWAREAAAKGISTTCFGVGESFDEDLLGAMADAGGGTYHYVAGIDEAPAKFAEEFGDLALLAAQNVSVEVRGSAHVTVLGVLNEYPVVPVAGGLQAQLGDAYAGQVRRVVVRLVVPALAELGPAKVADVVVRYTALGDEPAMHEVTLPVVVNAVSAEDAAAAVPDGRVVEEVTLLEAAKDVEEARRRGDAGDVHGSRLSLDAAAEKLSSYLPYAADPAVVEAQAERIERLRQSVSSEGYTGRSKKVMHDFTHSNRRGRR